MRQRLNGEVVGDGDKWLYDYFEIPAFTPQDVRQAIADTPEGEECIFEINSHGGAVSAGFEIYSVLRESPRHTVAVVQSIAASAASTIMVGCDEVRASPVAQIMIHLPMTATQGDQTAHRESIDILDSITESILNGYVAKCGSKTTRQELRALMRASTWMTAPEAKGLGLVDSIIGEETFDPATVLNCAPGVPGYIRSSARPLRTLDGLRDEYASLVAAGKAPARNGIGEAPEQKTEELTQAKALLELEKIRFEGGFSA